MDGRQFRLPFKIISGGQTGVDRAALDVALQLGIDCGGWCPAGRLDENGRIPAHYPLQELPRDGFAERTRQNVQDSDATVVFHRGELHGGTADTVRCCLERQRPHIVIDAARQATTQAAALLRDFLRAHQPAILNVAGPRASEWPDGYSYVSGVLELVLRER